MHTWNPRVDATEGENEITLHADDELKLRQMHELLQGHLTRRKIDAGVLNYKTAEAAAGQRWSAIRH